MTSPEGQTAGAEYVSPSIEVLETLEMQSALSTIEARLDSFEIDLARVIGSREDDARRLAGEMAVMRARVEDAVAAVSATAEELRALCRDLEKKVELESVARGETAAADVQAQVRAGIDGMMAGVGDVLESVSAEMRSRIDRLASSMGEVQGVVERVAASIALLVPITERIDQLEEAAAARDGTVR